MSAPNAHAPATEIAQRLLKRVDAMWSRFERTGDQRWMNAAIEADRMYLQMKDRLS